MLNFSRILPAVCILVLYMLCLAPSVNAESSPGPVFDNIIAPLITPADRNQQLSKRVLPKISTRASRTGEPNAPEVVEMARALWHDVDMIYEYVYNEIEFEPTFGVFKGPLGTLVDKSGNAYDISSLMVEMLRESGYTAQYVYGNCTISGAQAMEWYDLPNNAEVMERFLGAGGIPAVVTGDGGDGVASVTLSHIWVQVEIEGSDYAFDPSFKTYTEVSGLDEATLRTAIGYANATSFMDTAMANANATVDYVQGLDRDFIRSSLSTYADNLADYLESNHPTAKLEEIIGGREIQDLGLSPIRQASLPYQDSIESGWPKDEIPDEFRTFVTISFYEGSVALYSSHTLSTDEFYAKRFTISNVVNENYKPKAELRLEGVLLIEGPLGVNDTCGARQTIEFTIDHIVDDYSKSNKFEIFMGKSIYYIHNHWGRMGSGMIQRRRDALAKAKSENHPGDSEIVLGNDFGILSSQYICQKQTALDITNVFTQLKTFTHYVVGVMGQEDCLGTMFESSRTHTQVFDLRIGVGSILNVESNDDIERANAFSRGFGSAFEQGIIMQHYGKDAISTIKYLDMALERSESIVDTHNYVDLYDKLQNGTIINMSSWDLTMDGAIYTEFNRGSRLIFPYDCGMFETGWYLKGYGYIVIRPGEEQLAYIIATAKKHYTYGGSDTENSPEDDPDDDEDDDNDSDNDDCDEEGEPIQISSGYYLNRHTDLTIGGKGSPGRLAFSRTYSSGARYSNSTLGRGWGHNYSARLRETSSGLRGLGVSSPLFAAGSIASLFVLQDILTVPDDEMPLDRIAASVAVTQWFMDQLCGNIVQIITPEATWLFTRMPDGSLAPPPGKSLSLEETGAGQYTLTYPQGEQWYFEDGRLVGMEDPNGNETTLTYDGNGLLSSIANDFGRSLALAYTGDLLTSVTDDASRSVSYGYDNGTLVTFEDAEDETTTYVYADPGLLTEVYYPTDPLNSFITNDYDALGRVETQTDAESNTWTYFFTGRSATEVDPTGNATSWLFDDYGRTLRKTDPLGFSWNWTYDGLNRLVQETLPDGRATAYAYDANHNRIEERRISNLGEPDLVWTYAYDPAFNKPVNATNPLGCTTTLGYNTAGNLTSITQPPVNGTAPVFTLTYTPQGQVETITDPEDTVTRMTYHAASGELLSITQDYGGLNLLTQITPSATGDPASVTDPRGNTTSYTYDDNRNLIAVTPPSPYNYATHIDRNELGLATAVRRETGDPQHPYAATSIDYTGMFKTGTVTDPESHVTQYEYDALNRLIRIIDPEERVTEFEYDAAGRRTATVNGNGDYEARAGYDENGRIASVTDANGNILDYSYDGYGRLSRITYPDDTSEEYGYDDAGNLTSVTTRAGQAVSMAYDSLNRLVSRALPDDTDSYAYDLAGRLTQASNANGAVIRAYDTAGRLDMESFSGRTLDYGYDAAGNVASLLYPNNATVTFAYDALNRLSAITESGQTLASYTYDPLGRRSDVEFLGGSALRFDFDLADRPQLRTHEFTGNATVVIANTFDDSGLLESQDISDPRFYPRVAGEEGEYNPNILNQYGMISGVDLAYDANGNLTSDGNATYSYDALNRLTAAQGSQNATYLYDALDRRAAKVVGGQATWYLYDGLREVGEYDGAGGELRRFVYGSWIDEPVCMANGTDRYFFHHDRLGTVAALADASGALAEAYRYTPFGGVETASALGNPYYFTGRRLDEETGLYYYRARMYDPTLGRFLQPDPIGISGGVNLYRYVLNAPTAYVDPYGENPVAAIYIIFAIETILNIDFKPCDDPIGDYDYKISIPPPSTWEVGIPFPYFIGVDILVSNFTFPFIGDVAIPLPTGIIITGDPVYQQLPPPTPWEYSEYR